MAALLPRAWTLRLVDLNVERWRPALLDQADLVLVGGMITQQEDALAIVREARRRGRTVVVGGPDATSSPHLYLEADHLVLGEAETTLPTFLADHARGRARHVYEETEKPDVAISPCPRFDLLDVGRYLHVGVQRSRGCPFQCEFCDIIELYGRVPRPKTTDQMLGELQVLYDLGYRGHVDFVDDNFIGDRKATKAFLRALRDWLEERNWPFEFSTEASINLADDDELLDLMQEVGFFTVFVGIESPDEDTLLATKKRQNTRRSIVESIRKIQRHGMFVLGGYILGLDGERTGVARDLIALVEDAAIPVNMVGLLYALPNTQLTRRLRREGRLTQDTGLRTDGQCDQCTEGLNFETLRPRREILSDYLEVIETLYEPGRYFDRVRRTTRLLDASKRKIQVPLGEGLASLVDFLRFAWILGVRRDSRRHFWRTMLHAVRHNPAALYQVVVMCALYIHFGPYARLVAARTRDSLRRCEEPSLRPAARPRPPQAPRATASAMRSLSASTSPSP